MEIPAEKLALLLRKIIDDFGYFDRATRGILPMDEQEPTMQDVMLLLEVIKTSEYERGIVDCMAGIPTLPGASKWYLDGYSAQFHAEQQHKGNN